MIPASITLDSILQYLSVELKLNSQTEPHIEDRHGHGNRDRPEDCSHREIQDVPDRSSGSEDGKASSGGMYITQEDHEDANFLALAAHNRKVYGHDKAKWSKAPCRQGKEPRRIVNPPLSLNE